MKAFYLLIQYRIFDLNILNFRFKIVYHITWRINRTVTSNLRFTYPIQSLLQFNVE